MNVDSFFLKKSKYSTPKRSLTNDLLVIMLDHILYCVLKACAKSKLLAVLVAICYYGYHNFWKICY